MPSRLTIRSSALLFATIMLAAGSLPAQTRTQRYSGPAGVKVPAVSQVNYLAPEVAPQLNEPLARPNQNRKPQANQANRSKHSNHVKAAAHVQPMPYSGEMVMEDVGPGYENFDMVPGNHPHDAGCGPDCGVGCCDVCGPEPCFSIWENLQIFGGVQGFKNPVDQGQNGNFGFHEGVNWGGPVFEYGGIGGQIGFEAVQSNLAESTSFEDNRIQTFFTTGLFHRPFDNNGWQGGVVFDWLHDDYYVQMDVAQIRGEISWLCCGHHELGAWTAIGVTSDRIESSFNEARVSWEPIDMYALFYRRYFENGAIGRFSAGFTGDGQGLLGADALAPLSQHCALVVNANYIIGDNAPRPNESLSESWGLTISLAWFPGYKSCCSPRNPYRPIFGVADNTSMMLNYRGPSSD